MKTFCKIVTPILVVIAAIASAYAMVVYGVNDNNLPPKL
jgi:hypothetical protein